jgi:hypothetical protein
MMTTKVNSFFVFPFSFFFFFFPFSHSNSFSLNQQGVQSQIHALLPPLLEKYPTFPVIYTGHSLGAALAVLCATDTIDTGEDHLVLFTVAHCSFRLLFFFLIQPKK